MPVNLSSEMIFHTDGEHHSAATLAGGNVAVAWSESTVSAVTTKVRVLAPDGTALGTVTTLANVQTVEVAALAGGGFVVVWAEHRTPILTVKAQLFDASGMALGSPKVVEYSDQLPDTISHRAATVADVIGLSDGGFAVAWKLVEGGGSGDARSSVTVATVDASGVVEARFTEAQGGSQAQNVPIKLVETASGQVTATWSETNAARDGVEQFVRTIDANGAVGPAIKIGEHGPEGPDGDDFWGSSGAAVAGLPGGDVAIAWKGAGGVWVSIYDGADLAGGVTASRTLPQLLAAADVRSAPDMAVLPDGSILVSWAAPNSLMGARIGSDGRVMGEIFQVGEPTGRPAVQVELAPLGDDRFLALWREPDAGGYTALRGEVVWLGGPVEAGAATSEHMVGGAGAEALAALEGADTLAGGGGADTLSGGPGADVFMLRPDAGVDRVLDFSSAAGDRLDVRDASGTLAPDDLLILDRATGLLSWDRDDVGPAPPVEVAVLDDVEGLSRSDFAPGVQPSGIRVLLAGGGRMDTVFDWGQQAFEEATSTFDVQGRVTTYFVRNDDGTSGQRWWDVEATQPWRTRAAEYDPAGQVKAYAVTYDNGRTEVYQFDVTNARAWTRLVDGYDAEGRQSVQAVAWDDGTAFERHHDTYDVHPWAYYIDNYRDGVLLNHTFYNADGSVFVG